MPLTLDLSPDQVASASPLRSSLQKLIHKDWKTHFDQQAAAVQDFLSALTAAVVGDASTLQLKWAETSDIPDPETSRTLAWCQGEALRALSSGTLSSLGQQDGAVQAKFWKEYEERAARIPGEAGLRMLQTLIPSPPLSRHSNRSHRTALTTAARNGLLEHIQWLRRAGVNEDWDSKECAQLVACTPAWQALEQSPPESLQARFGSPALCTLAVELQHLNTLAKLRAATPPFPFEKKSAVALAGAGCMQAMQQMLSEANAKAAETLAPLAQHLARECAQAAAAGGHLRELLWLWETFAPPSAREIPNTAGWTLSVVEAASRGGHASVMEWTWGMCPLSFWEQKAEAGEQAGLQWLAAHYLPCSSHSAQPSEESIQQAKMWQAIAALPQLPEPDLLSKIPMNADSCRQAARFGKIELLAWLKGKECPWDVRACNMAARYGHLSVLQWLRNQPSPCPWSAHTSLLAAQYDQPDVLLWLLEQGCPPPSRPELASDKCLGTLVQQQLSLSPAAVSRAAALGLLSTPLVVGLVRWMQKTAGKRKKAGPGSFPQLLEGGSSQLLQDLSTLPEDVVFHICGLAGMCKPIKKKKST